MEFTVSKKEISRRKKAFLTLVISLFFGLFLASFFLNYPVSKSGYLLILVIILFISGLTFWFLDSVLKIKLRISDEKIERMNGKNIQSLTSSKIKEIKIKRRTNGIIREIYIWSYDKRNMFLTAFEENFEEIKEILKNKITTDVVVKEIREPIDFDHPLFYSLLGLPICFFSIYFLNLISGANSSQAKIIMFIYSVFMLFLGVYFIFKKPISARYEGKRAVIDYVIGTFMVCVGVFMFFVGLNF
ncbi:MAG: hypothetical protein WC514_02560 [Candidatus Paceibacterota bacterium]